MNTQHFGLVPLRNFAVVDHTRKIYRSAQPLYRYEYKWLKETLGIGIIVNLRSEIDVDSKFAPEFGIKVITFAVKDHTPPTKEQADEFMKLIKNAGDEGILFHCEHGRGRTSTFCILSRLALDWDIDKAIEEEEKVFHYQFAHHFQKQFIVDYAQHLK